jgi:transposase
LFRWFVGLGVDEASWDPTTFGKNRDRLLAGDVAHKFLAAVLACTPSGLVRQIGAIQEGRISGSS